MKKQRVIVLTEQDLSDILGKLWSAAGISAKDIFGGLSGKDSKSTSDSSSKDPIQEVLSSHNNDHTNWRYVNHRKATTSYQFKGTIVVSLFLMPGIAKEVRRFKGRRYFNSNEDPRASTKIASTYQDDLE